MTGDCRALLFLLVFDELFKEYDDDANCTGYQGNFCNVDNKCVKCVSIASAVKKITGVGIRGRTDVTGANFKVFEATNNRLR